MTGFSVEPITFSCLEILRRLPWPDVPNSADSDKEIVQAGVLLPISYGSSGLSVVLTRRSLRVANHKDEMCFPGGVKEPSDIDIQRTALREAFEELGIIPDDVKILGRLHPVSTNSGFRVWPVVGYIPPCYGFQINSDEVSEVIEVPLSSFCSEEGFRQEAVLEDGSLRKRSSFVYGGRVIHGATARILGRFMRIVAERLPEGALL